MMKVVLNLVLTATTCLFLSSVHGGHLAIRRADRERRQGYSEVQRSSAVVPGVLYSAPSHQPQPEGYRVYSLPRTAESPRPAELSISEETQVGGQTGEEGQVTTTELSSTPNDESSVTPKKVGQEEGVSEEYPGGLTNPSEDPEPTTVTQEEQPSTGGQERTDENEIRNFGGYSMTPGTFYRMKVTSQEEVSRGENNQPKKFNLVAENYIPNSFSNEIPHRVLRPIDQQQVENTFYSIRPIVSNNQRQIEEEGFRRQLGTFRQPIRTEYEQRPQEIQSQPDGGYGPPPRIHYHRIVEGKPNSMEIQKERPIEERSREIPNGGMSLEGLENHIVDANLLERVQQIIENHERQQRDFLKRFQEEQEQVQFPNGNAGRVPVPQGGYAATVGGNQENPQNKKLAGNGEQQGTLSSANFFQRPQEFGQGGSSTLFRESKSFPGNPNLEFQPAILTGQFEEKGLERVNKAEERQRVYVPPTQQQQQQPQFQQRQPQQHHQYPVEQQPQFQQQERQPQQQPQQHHQYPQQQQNVQYQPPGGNVNFPPRSQDQYPQQQFYSSPLPSSHAGGYSQQPLNGQQPSTAQVYRQPEILPVELPYVHREPPTSSISAERGQVTFPFEPKPEEGIRTAFMSPQPGYDLSRGPFPGINGKTEEGKPNSITGETENSPNPYVYNSGKSEGKDNRNSLEHFSESGPFRKETTKYLPPGTLLPGRRESSPAPPPPHFQGGESNLISRGNQGPRVNPNVITRTIVVHEQPAGTGNPGLSNRVILTGDDMGGRTSQFPSPPSSSFLNNHHPLSVGNEVEVNQERPPQYQYLGASAQLTVGHQQSGPATGYNAPQQSNGVPVTSEEEIEKPRPVYGIPIAPVLGPESLDDSVVIDARGAPAGSNYVENGQSPVGLSSQNGGSRDQPNAFAFYRLPKSEGNNGGYATQQQEPENQQTNLHAAETRRRDVNFQQFQGAGQRRSRNIQNGFSPAVASPLAGYFSTAS